MTREQHRHRWEQCWEWSSLTCTFKVFRCVGCPQFKARHYGCHSDAEMSDDLLAQLRDSEAKLAKVVLYAEHREDCGTGSCCNCGLDSLLAQVGVDNEGRILEGGE